jgi:hypothetical protein
MPTPRPTPIKTDIRIAWVVYEFATRADADQFLVWARENHIETRGALTDQGRHFVWSRD